MADQTKIVIHQSLHGYQNGHQLIASSREFSSEVKKTLVYQTDLSGSYVDNGFETYIFGFPIPGELTFALCRSWYANEMKRPGCVWTHTLFIQHGDIGKFPELAILLKYFKRPEAGSYQYYQRHIELLKSEILSQPGYRPTDIELSMMSTLYLAPKDIVLVPAITSHEYESAVVNLWSNQWPRLRRHFTFSTGSLGIRALSDREFDLQIIPDVSKSTIERQVKTGYVFNDRGQISEDLIEAFRNDKFVLREFLWTYGADIAGLRENYLPLIKTFLLIHDTASTFLDIVNHIRKNFPDASDAKYLKREIFGKESILVEKVSENELVIFLLEDENLDFLPFGDLSLEDRLLELIEAGNLDLSTIIRHLDKIKNGRISSEIGSFVDFSEISIEQLMKIDEEVILQVLEDVIGLGKDPTFWLLSQEINRKAIDIISRQVSSNNWHDYIVAILEANSEAIFYAYTVLGNTTIFCSLDWLNSSSKSQLLPQWQEYIVVNRFDVFKNWILRNEESLSISIFAVLLAQANFERAKCIKLKASTWIRAYETIFNLTNSNEFVIVACQILSIGLNNLAYRSDLIVERSFTDVFYFAKNSNISQNDWQGLPKDQYPMDDGDINSFIDTFGALMRLLPWNTKVHRKVPSWDYCEILVRTVSNKFIKNGWPRQSFLGTMRTEEVFVRSVSFYAESNKGQKFLNAVLNDIRQGRIKPFGFQWKILNSQP